MTDAVLRALGGMPVRAFLDRYWGRRPQCVRAALGTPGPFVAPVPRERLLALAGDEDVESRLVTSFGGTWKLRHGPFARRSLPALSRPGWTLLVQGVDLHERAAADLAARFRFLPAARFDDVMMSYATDGGGVGPHVDQYDVFLLQAQGRRRWRIARHFDPALVEGAPVRLLRNFRPEQEFVLEPGDLLYLPPGVAHDGIALGESITVSVGFRVLPWQEIAQAWFDQQAECHPIEGRMREGRIQPARQAGRLSPTMVQAAHAALAPLRPTLAQARRALLCALTEPKPQVWFPAPSPPLGRAAFDRVALSHGVRTCIRSRMLHAGALLALNGELVDPGLAPRAALARLADRRALEGPRISAFDPAGREALLTLLHDWYRSGWIEPMIE